MNSYYSETSRAIPDSVDVSDKEHHRIYAGWRTMRNVLAMNRLLLLLVCCGLVLFSGLIHGLWSDRWNSSAALEDALARVPHVPMSVGDWNAENIEVDPVAYAQAGAQKYWMRCYHHVKTGEEISVILMCGRAGKMSVHTPDVCYQGSGYESEEQARRVTIPLSEGPVAHFWTASFAKENSALDGQLRLFWSWSAAGAWEVPDHPRFTFRDQPALFKLYVIRQTPPSAGPPENDPAIPFLQELLPQLGKALFTNLAP
jgi:hypothetical protein